MIDCFHINVAWFDDRFEGVVQGKELDAILQNEVGPDDEEELLKAQTNEDHVEEEQHNEEVEEDVSDGDEAVSGTLSVILNLIFNTSCTHN